MAINILDMISGTNFDSQEENKILDGQMDLIINKLMKNLTFNGNKLQIDGRVIKIVNDPYNTLIREINRRSIRLGKRFDEYIMKSFGNPYNFNHHMNIFNKVGANEEANRTISFDNEEGFDLIFKGTKIYKIKDKSESNMVEYFGDLTERFIERKLYIYLRVIKRLEILKNVKQPNIVYNAILNDLTNKKFCIQEDVKPVSNNPQDYCYSYINLDFRYQLKNDLKYTLEFLDQIEEYDRSAFCIWVYNIFNMDDRDRRIMYLYGEAKTGKTTFVNVICDYLRNINPNLVGAITDERSFSRFSLSGIENRRLLVYSDANDRNLFKRSEILNITGGDLVEVQSKNIESKHVNVFCKIIVTSNFMPKINKTAKHESSRLLLIRIRKKYTVEIENHILRFNWLNEFGSFLSYIKRNYIK